MKLRLKILGEATAVGLIDVGLEKLDSEMGLVKPFNALTMGRAAMFIAGLGLNALTDKGSDYTEALYVASEPLLIRSIFSNLGVIPDSQMAPSKHAIELRMAAARHGQLGFPGANTGGPMGTGYGTNRRPAQGLAQFR